VVPREEFVPQQHRALAFPTWSSRSKKE
jgi:hypothetical protein